MKLEIRPTTVVNGWWMVFNPEKQIVQKRPDASAMFFQEKDEAVRAAQRLLTKEHTKSVKLDDGIPTLVCGCGFSETMPHKQGWRGALGKVHQKHLDLIMEAVN